MFIDELNAIDHYIPWQDAVIMVKRYDVEKQNMIGGAPITPDTLLDYETFNMPAIYAILQQQGCAGFRIYNGMDENNEVRCILVGVDMNGHDVIMTNGACPLLLVDEAGQRFP